MSTERIRLPNEVIRGGNYCVVQPMFVPVAGVAGATGLSGPTGIQGMTGVYVQVGIQGLTGLVGAVGSTGLSGPTGDTGQTGIRGLTGIQGRTGIQGGGGDTGIRGYTGIRGTTGIQGITGFYGVTGIQGDRGLQGLVGSTGIAGSGSTGLQGIQGLVGSTGIAGSGGTIGGSGTANTLPIWTDSTTLGDSKLTEDTNGITYQTANTNVWSITKTLNTGGAAMSRIQSDTAELMVQAYGSAWPTTGGGVDGGDASGGIILEAVGNFTAINQQSVNKKLHLTYRHDTKLAIDSTGTMVDTLKGFNNTKVTTQFGLRSNQINLTHGLTNVLPASIFYDVEPQLGGIGPLGSPIITGIAHPDGCVSYHTPLTLRGICDETDPNDDNPQIELIGSKSDGSGNAAYLDSTESILSISNAVASNAVARVRASGALEIKANLQMGILIPITPPVNTASIYFDGTNVIAVRSDGSHSTLSGTWA